MLTKALTYIEAQMPNLRQTRVISRLLLITKIKIE